MELNQTPNSPVVLHIPHASTRIPSQARAHLLLDDQQLGAELLRMTDWFTDELFSDPAGKARAEIYPVSRLVVDPERFEDDEQEPMAARGMGVIYTRTSLQGKLRDTVSPATRAELLNAYYRPHHARLTTTVDGCLETFGRCLLIDCHSFASTPLPYEVDQAPGRPDICLGTDGYHTPPGLVEQIGREFSSMGLSVELNRPYAGALVPLKHYRRTREIAAVMIEVRRGLYMDELNGFRSTGFMEMKQAIGIVLDRLHELIHRQSAPNPSHPG